MIPDPGAFVLIVVLFFGAALLYSMVGFGGGSSYLALLVIFRYPLLTIPAQALICNIVVAGGGFLNFRSAGHFDFKKSLPFVVSSVPFAYLGGRIGLSKELLCVLLGFSLFLVAVQLLVGDPNRQGSRVRVTRAETWVKGSLLGAFLGFASGIIGIGGGIFLSPLLLLMRWCTAKQAAATASFFILVNSIAGLTGQLNKGHVDFKVLLPLAVAVLIGGQIGSRLGAFKMPNMALRRLLAVLVMYVSIRLLAGAV